MALKTKRANMYHRFPAKVITRSLPPCQLIKVLPRKGIDLGRGGGRIYLWDCEGRRSGDRIWARLSRPRFRRAPAFHHMDFIQGLPVTPSLPVRVSLDSDRHAIRASSRGLSCESCLDWDHLLAWRSVSKRVHTKSCELECADGWRDVGRCGGLNVWVRMDGMVDGWWCLSESACWVRKEKPARRR